MRREMTGANQRLTTFGCGLLLTLAFGWWGAAGAAQGSGGAVIVCVGADSVLRLAENERPCRPGEQRFLLAPAAAVSSEDAGQKKTAPQKPAPRPANSDGQPTRFTAPFEIVDRRGAPILSVKEEDGESSRGLFVLNAAGNILVQVTGMSGDAGGRVQARSGKSKAGPWVGFGYLAEGPAFIMQNSDGQSLFEANKLGMNWYNAQELPVVQLGAGESGKAGYFSLYNEKGTQVVEAGALKDGRGIVRVFPNKGQASLIPQFLMGSKP